MSVEIRVDPKQWKEFKRKLGSKNMLKALDIALFNIGSEVRETASKGAPYKSGNLRRSLALEKGDKQVVVGTNVVYAAIHEFGGVIRPKNSPYLAFQIEGQWIFARSVTIPKRPYMKPAADEMKAGRGLDILMAEFQKAL